MGGVKVARKKKTTNAEPIYKVKLKDGHTGVILKHKTLLARDGYVLCSAEELEQLKTMEVIA